MIGQEKEGRTSRSAGGDNGAVKARLGDDVDLDGGVTTGVVDGAGVDLGNGHDESRLGKD